MKKNSPLFFLIFVLAICFQQKESNAQATPEWTRTINAFPDSFPVYPVRILHDMNSNYYVLSTYQHSITVTNSIVKIVLTQYDYTGNENWRLVYDHNGSGEPRGFDMTLDNAGNCYIAGAFMGTINMEPILLKVTSSGSVAWQHTGTTAFNTGHFTKIIYKNNKLFLNCSSGVAVFDTAGNEVWSVALSTFDMAVDDSSRVIVSAFSSGAQTLFRYNANGSLDFSDSTIYGSRVICDAPGNIYILGQENGYSFVKYNSNGQFVWSRDHLATPQPFLDAGLEIIMDYTGDIYLIGLQDSIFKFSPNGNIIWAKSMNGLDGSKLSAQILSSNSLVVTGSLNGFAGYDLVVSAFDLNGQVNWLGYYSGNTGGREFSQDISVDGTGIYVIEDNDNYTTLVKFKNPTMDTVVDYNLICVDSVWYDPIYPNLIHVNVFNGGQTQINYPSIQIVSPLGDTIGNPNNYVNFFAQLGNTYQEYVDTIVEAGITDFSNYTFLLSELFGATTNQISWCISTSVPELNSSDFALYPNLVGSMLHIYFKTNADSEMRISIYSMTGALVFREKYNSKNELTLDLNLLSSGIYNIVCENSTGISAKKFMKQ